MKRILNNIFIVVLMLSLFGSLSCQSLSNPKHSEPNKSDNFFTGTQGGSTSGITSLDMTSFTGMQGTTPVKTELLSVKEAGATVLSRTYPWAECGIVQVDKIMPKEVGMDKPFNYTINITNLTDTMLTDIIISEDYSGNFKFVSANPVAQESTNKLTWEIDSLGPKATRQIKVTGEATYTEPIKHCTTVITPVVPLCSNVEVIQPKLKLTKTIPSETLLCDMIPLRYVVTNAGTGTVPGVRIVDSLPAGLRTTDGKGEIAFEAGSLGAGQSREFSTELRASKAGKYFSKAQASSSTGLRVESEETTTVVGQPMLTINKNGPDKLYIGRAVTYEITVSNKSEVAAKDTVVEDTIPDGVNSVQASAGANLSGSKLIWKLGTLAPNSSQNLSVSYIPTKAGVLSNDVKASAYCAEAVTAAKRTTVTGIPAVMLEVVDIEDPVRVGKRVTYVIRVTNQGSAPLTNIRINCELEDNVQYVSSAGATAGSAEANTAKFIPLNTLAPQGVAIWRVIVGAVKPGDVRFKVIMNSDDLSRPVEKSESTYIYE
jgi:uncharacterized repeat protein (TIGR01451 family)